MKVYGLIGYPLTHSFSAEYFREKFRKEGICDARYRNFPLSDIHEFPHLLSGVPELAGLNVTIPYKESVMPFLDSIDDVACEVGAVNVVCFLSGGKTRGYNTDITGFSESIKPYIRPHHKNALILGTGGASKSVAWALRKMGIGVRFVSRTPVSPGETDYKGLTDGVIRSHPLIVQTTPLGMHPNDDGCPPIPYEYIGPGHLLYDLVYNPCITRFMEKGMEKGATAVNGMQMLRIQAEESWKLWNTVH